MGTNCAPLIADLFYTVMKLNLYVMSTNTVLRTHWLGYSTMIADKQSVNNLTFANKLISMILRWIRLTLQGTRVNVLNLDISYEVSVMILLLYCSCLCCHSFLWSRVVFLSGREFVEFL
jgi:hypothetical protein